MTNLTMLLATLVLASDIALVLFALLSIAALFSGKLRALRRILIGILSANALPLAFLVALVSTLGSLYFSEILNYVPCELCWFQRIFMYPQVVIFAIALLRNNRRIFSYTIPLSAIGGSISAYNYWLQLAAANATSCSGGVSCADIQFLAYGYITIATMALTGFILIVFLGLTSRKSNR
jgi:disulfide bond formation protein DsbB